MIYSFQFFWGRSYCVGEYFGPQGSPALPILTWKMYFIFYPFHSWKAKTRIILVRILNVRILETEQKLFLTNCDKTFYCLFCFWAFDVFSDKGITCNISNARKEGVRRSWQKKLLVMLFHTCKRPAAMQEYDQT